MSLTYILLCFLCPALLFAHTSYPEKVKCPIDGAEVTIYHTMSMTTMGTYPDFMEYGGIGSFYDESISSCPKCRYAGYNADFDSSVQFNEEQRTAILHLTEPYRSSTCNDEIECEIAAKIYRYLDKKKHHIGNIYLIGSYIVKGNSAKNDIRIRFQSEAITNFKAALEKGEIKAKQEPNLTYLVGELYRRIGEFEQAVSYYDKALKFEEKPDWLEKAVSEQRPLAIARNSENNDRRKERK